MKRVFHFLWLLTALSVASCVYDFHPDWQGQAGYVAIEGDILIGDSCRFDVRFSTDLEDPKNSGAPLTYSLRVEARDGAVYPMRDSIVDLTSADRSQEYRLVVEVSAPFRRTYASEWAPVQVTPPIDSLSWSVEADGSKLWVNVSTHSDGDVGYYRWSAAETWEYYATYYAEYYFSPATGTILEYEDGENTYFCWKSADHNDILLGSTKELSEDRLVNYGIISFTPEDRKVSYVYFVEVTQTRLSEAGFRFWETVRNNSSNVGGLFSPEPTEMRGNIVNVENPEELVLGFISVSTRSRGRLFIENSTTLFSRWHGPSYGIEYPFPSDYWKYYGWQYRVGWWDVMVGAYSWLPGECVDCRFSGGTKERPWWWINDDK